MELRVMKVTNLVVIDGRMDSKKEGIAFCGKTGCPDMDYFEAGLSMEEMRERFVGTGIRMVEMPSLIRKVSMHGDDNYRPHVRYFDAVTKEGVFWYGTGAMGRDSDLRR